MQLHRAAVHPHHVAVLPFHVTDVGILGIEGHVVTICTECHAPVLATDTFDARGTRGAIQRAEILRASEDVVEGLGIVGGDSIELRDRQVRYMPERFTMVEGFVQACVGADE